VEGDRSEVEREKEKVRLSGALQPAWRFPPSLLWGDRKKKKREDGRGEERKEKVGRGEHDRRIPREARLEFFVRNIGKRENK